MRKEDGSMTDTYEESKKIILEYNFRNIVEEDYIFRRNLIQDNQDIKMTDIERTVLEIKNNKTPGFDKITGELIKAMFNISKELFLRTFNNIFGIVVNSQIFGKLLCRC